MLLANISGIAHTTTPTALMKYRSATFYTHICCCVLHSQFSENDTNFFQSISVTSIEIELKPHKRMKEKSGRERKKSQQFWAQKKKSEIENGKLTGAMK